MKSFKNLFSIISLSLFMIVFTSAIFYATSCGGGGTAQIVPQADQNNNGNSGNENNGNDNKGNLPDDDVTNPPDDGTTPPDDNGGTTLPNDGGVIPPDGGSGSVPSPDATAPVLEGTVDVSGIPVTDVSGLPADVTRTTLKVIDPSEEIGDVLGVSPAVTGLYSIGGLSPALVNYLNISFNTNVDLKGVGQVVTPVSVNIPIQLASGVATKVNTVIAVYAPKTFASVRIVSKDGSDDPNGDDDLNDDGSNDNEGDDGGIIDDGSGDNGTDDDGVDDGDGFNDIDEDSGSIEITYSYEGPDGIRSGRFIIDYRANQTIYDMDDDGAYFDDTPHVDGDNDGIRDDRNEDDRMSGEFVKVEAEGLVEELGSGFVKVRGISFTIDERTNFKDGIHLSQIFTGSAVKIKGYKTPSDKVYADEIELE